MLLIEEKKIRRDYGSISAFLRKHGFYATDFDTLKKKKTDVFHENSASHRIVKILLEEGYAKYNDEVNPI